MKENEIAIARLSRSNQNRKPVAGRASLSLQMIPPLPEIQRGGKESNRSSVYVHMPDACATPAALLR